MYAIANISGKQYKVEVGQTLLVDRLNAEVGEEVSFPVMLSVDGDKVKAGKPVVKDVVVKAKVVFPLLTGASIMLIRPGRMLFGSVISCDMVFP